MCLRIVRLRLSSNSIINERGIGVELYEIEIKRWRRRIQFWIGITNGMSIKTFEEEGMVCKETSEVVSKEAGKGVRFAYGLIGGGRLGHLSIRLRLSYMKYVNE